MRSLVTFGLCLVLLSACHTGERSDQESFTSYCNLVADEIMPMAFYRFPGREVPQGRWEALQEEAAGYGVSLEQEENLPNTLLFPKGWSDGQSIILMYKGDRLTQYRQWKQDVEVADSSEPSTKEALARRLGRLLGMSPQGINKRLRQNDGYRTLSSFGVQGQTTHLFYADLPAAQAFYADLPGIIRKDSTLFQIADGAYLRLHAHTEEHPEGQAQSTAIALLTDALPAWYAYAEGQNIPIKYPLKIREGGPHDGFVAIDPGGYLLEFETFKQHPENEALMAALAGPKPSRAELKASLTEPKPSRAEQKPSRAESETAQNAADALSFYGSITWTYHKDLLGMQRFYEELLGFTLVADQGWTKIYQTSHGGFIGLVDERRGMQDFAEEKAVEIEWSLKALDSLDSYAQKHWERYGYRKHAMKGPESYRYRFSQQP